MATTALWEIKIRATVAGDVQLTLNSGYWLTPAQMRQWCEHLVAALDAIDTLADKTED